MWNGAFINVLFLAHCTIAVRSVKLIATEGIKTSRLLWWEYSFGRRVWNHQMTRLLLSNTFILSSHTKHRNASQWCRFFFFFWRINGLLATIMNHSSKISISFIIPRSMDGWMDVIERPRYRAFSFLNYLKCISNDRCLYTTHILTLSWSSSEDREKGVDTKGNKNLFGKGWSRLDDLLS